MANGETDRLFEILNAYSVPPSMLESGLPGFSVASRNELAARVARQAAGPPASWLLARLQFIRTDENRPDLESAYLANLGAADPEARKFSLYGLQKLDHPALRDHALAALADPDDRVVSAACTILLPGASADASIAEALRRAYATHREDAEFHMTRALLAAHGMDRKPEGA